MLKHIYKTLLYIIIACGVFLRLLNLGYSDFQGDEVTAQNFLFGEQSFVEFLLTRTVGPLQFVVAALGHTLSSLFQLQPEFIVRLPFALASVASVLLMYFIGKKFFSEEVGLYASLLLSVSGLFLAFARIVQYQSFVILISLCTLYFFLVFLKENKWNALIFAGTLSGFGLLFHYDSLSITLSVLLIILFLPINFKLKLKAFLYYLLPFGLVTLAFYTPFVFQPTFKSTLTYLISDRISSEFKYDSIYYTIRLFHVYHPKEFILLLLLLIGFSLHRLFLGLIKTKASAYDWILLIFLIVLVMLRTQVMVREDILIWISTGFALLLLFNYLTKYILLSSKVEAYNVILIYFFGTLTVYCLFFTKPLTHMYNFLLPLFLLLSINVHSQLKKFNSIYLTYLVDFVLILLGIVTLSFDYQVFVNSSPEYPWNTKKYLGGTLYTKLPESRNLYGIFGFPYNRDWKKIRMHLDTLNVKSYKSNEKYRLTKYYLKGYKWDDFNNEVFIWIKYPQSLDLSLSQRPTDDVLFEDTNYVILKGVGYKY